MGTAFRESAIWLVARVVPLAVCLYILQLGFPIGNEVALYVLAVAGLLLLIQPEESGAKGLDLLSKLLLAFLLASVVSLVLGNEHARAIETSFAMFPATLLYMLVRGRFQPRQMRWLSWSFTVASAMVAATVLAVALRESDPDPTYLMSRVPLPYLSVPNDLALIGLCSPMILACLMETDSPVWRVLLAAILLLVLAAIVVYRSNLALLAVGFCVLMMMLYTRHRRSVATIAAVLSVALLIDGLSGFPLMEKFLRADVWGNRLPLWLASGAMFLDAPWLGHGPGSFSLLFGAYEPTAGLPAWVIPDPRHAPWAHSIYLELLAERGVVGFVLFAGCVATGIRLLSGANLPQSARIHAIAMKCTLLGLLLAGSVDLSLLRYWVVTLFAVVLGGASMLNRHPQKN